jgi:hypothetical protein
MKRSLQPFAIGRLKSFAERAGFCSISHQLIRGLAFFLIAMNTACSGADDDTRVPEYILEMENVTIYNHAQIEAADTIKLVREQVFGDTDEVYIGQVREFISDESGRVYIVDSAIGARAIYVYAPDGSYITTIGRMGRGPGEYLNPCCLQIRSNRLFVFDHGLARLTIFSMDSWEVLETVTMDRNRMSNAGQAQEKRFLNYSSLDDETLLLAFTRPQYYFEDSPGSMHYFTSDTAFSYLGDEVLKQDQILEVWGEWNGQRVMKYFPFYSKPLMTVTPSGRIFYADSDEFLIRELNKEGKKTGGLYLPISGVPLNRDDAIGDVHEMERDIVNNAEIPERWPVMKSMWSDDQERLWISTFTEAKDELEWWIIKSDGESIARFRRPGDRNAYPLNSGRTFKHIRGDYFYTREDDEETGLQTVVRYRIEIGDADD